MSEHLLFIQEAGLIQPQGDFHTGSSWPAKVIEVKPHPHQWHLRVDPLSKSAPFTLVLTNEGHSPNVPGVLYEVKNPGEQKYHLVTEPGPSSKQ